MKDKIINGIVFLIVLVVMYHVLLLMIAFTDFERVVVGTLAYLIAGQVVFESRFGDDKEGVAE